MESQNHYINDVEAAKLLSSSPQTLRNWRFVGRGPAYVKKGRMVRYLVQDLINFMEAGRIDPEASPAGLVNLQAPNAGIGGEIHNFRNRTSRGYQNLKTITHSIKKEITMSEKAKDPLPNVEENGDGAMKEPEDQTDPFDLNNLRLSQNFGELVGVMKLLTTVPVRKPGKQDFFRVRPGDDWRLETMVLEIKEDRETYLVAPEIWPELPGELVPKVLFLTISRQGIVAIWPVRLPGEDGRQDAWSRSALEAADLGQKSWIRLAANMSLGAYEVFSAIRDDLPEPVWPEKTFKEVLEIAFQDKFIRTLDHPVIRRLKGAA